MLTFKEFCLISEAITTNDSLEMDQDDINYLNQFPKEYWVDALQFRYNKLLINSLDKDGNLKPGIKNVQLVTIGGRGGGGRGLVGSKGVPLQNFRVKTGILKLVKKLKAKGYDLSNHDEFTGTANSFNFMNFEQARKHLNAWKAHSGGEELVAGFSRYAPTKHEKKINSLDDKTQEEEIWKQIKASVKEQVESIVDATITSLSNPNHKNHINFYYWNQPENRQSLIDAAINKIKNNLGNQAVMLTASKRAAIIRVEIWSQLQRGIASRRNIEKFGHDKINAMIAAGYDQESIINAIYGRNYPKQPMSTMKPLKNHNINNNYALKPRNSTIQNKRASVDIPMNYDVNEPINYKLTT